MYKKAINYILVHYLDNKLFEFFHQYSDAFRRSSAHPQEVSSSLLNLETLAGKVCLAI